MSEIPKRIYGGEHFIVKIKDPLEKDLSGYDIDFRDDPNDVEFLLRIVDDSDPESPRQWDNVGTMACWHRRYTLGDKHEFSDGTDLLLTLATGLSSDEREDARTEWEYEHDDVDDPAVYDDPENWDKEKVFGLINEKYAILPLYLYDHSGITMSTGAFGCKWDSGQVGWIYVSKERVFAEYDITEENWREEAERYLKGEVEVYDSYLTGSVYGFELYKIEDDEATDLIDSCGGFYGNDSHKSIFEGYTIIRQTDIRTETIQRMFMCT